MRRSGETKERAMNLSTTRIARTALALFGVALLLPVAQASARPDTREDVGPIVVLSQQPAVVVDQQAIRRHAALAKLGSVQPQSVPSHLQDLQAMTGRYNAQTALPT